MLKSPVGCAVVGNESRSRREHPESIQIDAAASRVKKNP